MQYVMVGDTCQRCKGKGTVDEFGFYTVQTDEGNKTVCPVCHGAKIIGEWMSFSGFITAFVSEYARRMAGK